MVSVECFVRLNVHLGAFGRCVRQVLWVRLRIVESFRMTIISVLAQQRFFLRIACFLCVLAFIQPTIAEAVASANNNPMSRIQYIDAEFEQELLAAKIDFVLEKMMSVSTLPDATLFDSQRFFRSGKFFAAHYGDLSAQQRDKFMQCITI